MVIRVRKSGQGRNASSAGQSRGQKVWFDIKSNVLDNSIDEDKYEERNRTEKSYEISKRKLLSPY